MIYYIFGRQTRVALASRCSELDLNTNQLHCQPPIGGDMPGKGKGATWSNHK